MPVITISRMYGSGGSEVAQRVAAALGWSLLDNDIVDAIAERSGLTRAEVTAQDERVPSLVERLASALSLGSPEMLPPVPTGPVETTEERIVAVTQRVIEEAVQAGPAVFVGRGAQCLLAEREDALHVFCYAPKAALRRYAMDTFRVGQDEADKMVAEQNKQREQYVRRHWSRNWLAHENYHLCVNTAWLGIDGAAGLVVDAARKQFGESPGPRD
ncbi:MAG TPA: cytidylate kinase-like family protein [Gemmatimonadaceae bacterium]|jgi:cytidylate kinase|nr:cytidylate kinase-like family protein [Gemmatimonadaceae bacterium]